MNDEQLPGTPKIELVRLFSDFSDDRSLLEDGFLFQLGYPLPLRLALWLDYFLMAGQDRFQDKWAHLSLEEQQALGIELLKCYLSQPLFLRLSQEGISGSKKPLHISEKAEKLLQVEVESGATPEICSFYPLAHQRLWPDLLTVLKEAPFPSEEVFNRLQPELTIASSSRLETIRRRAETLGDFFLKGKKASVSPFSTVETPTKLENNGPFPNADIPAETPAVVNSFRAIEPTQTAPEGLDNSPTSPTSPPSFPKKKKKGKPSTDQLKLF
ncbi:MAG: hypothetical protein C0407_06790 [Desulfobacca sp.]|nr:hypothetical protein [Desulfobacca sp.]